MLKCPHCHREEQQVKVGRNPSGSQRYLCKVCRRKHTPQPVERGYSQEIRQQALRMVNDETNQRRTARGMASFEGMQRPPIPSHFPPRKRGERERR